MDSTNDNERVNAVIPVHIQDEMKNCYLDYAMSVIIGRALPDVRDGLKPVHRRVLYAMYVLNNYHNKPFLKSARVVGDVIGKYHPHGDTAVYGTIVRMAQEFTMRYQLIDGQGNFGSIDGDNAAAMRYTEIRMKKMSEEILKDLEKETVDWQPNYDDSLVEPKVMPTKIPNLLINGSSGIAVGMATNIPPHNITEIMNGLRLLLNNSECTNNDLMKVITGPDFPTGGTIIGTAGIKQAYNTGKGIIKIQAKACIETFNKNRERIVVTEIPYQVNKARLIEKMAEQVNSKQLVGISDIRDESNREGIRISIDIKRGENAEVILNRLYKNTQMKVSFGIIFLAINNGVPKVMDLKTQLKCFIDHRREIIIRRTIYELKKAKERAHILEGLKIAVENIDKIIQLIKGSSSPSNARQELIANYSLSKIQAQAILDMKLQRITGLERDKIIADYDEIRKKIIYLEGILSNEEKIKEIILEEFNEISENYNDKRKTDIEHNYSEIDIQDLITQEDVIVTITRNGYVKRMNIDTYKTQKRGGTGVKGSSLDNSEDFFTDIFVANTHSNLLIFTSKGTVFTKKVYQIPEASRTAKGRNLVNLINISSDEKISEIICVKDDEFEKMNLVFATKHGMIKKTKLSEYQRINQGGLRAIKIIDGDTLLAVRVSDGNKDILMCSSVGKIIRFNEKDCRTVGRVSQGSKGISISPKDSIIGMELIDDNMQILSVTEKGFGKRTLSSEYRKQSRAGKGLIAMKLTEKNGKIIAIKPVVDDLDLMIITDKGKVIRIKIADIALIGRSTQGVKIIRLKDNEKVVAVEKMAISDVSEE